jgi:hypothetical protein
MTGQELITELGNKGFNLFLSGGGIGYRYTGEGQPDPGMVVPILEELRRHKEEVRRLLNPILESRHLFETTVDDLARTCPDDLPSYLREHHPELWGAILDTQEVINDCWIELHGGKDVLSEIKGAVALFKARMLKGAEIYGESR